MSFWSYKCSAEFGSVTWCTRKRFYVLLHRFNQQAKTWWRKKGKLAWNLFESEYCWCFFISMLNIFSGKQLMLLYRRKGLRHFKNHVINKSKTKNEIKNEGKLLTLAYVTDSQQVKLDFVNFLNQDYITNQNVATSRWIIILCCSNFFCQYQEV